MLTRPFSVPKVWIPTKFTKLDAMSSDRCNLAGCENARASPLALKALKKIDPRWLTDHCESQDLTLRGKLAQLHGVAPEQVFLTSGAEAAIFYLFEMWVKGGAKNAGLLRPDYPAFEHFTLRNLMHTAWLKDAQYPFSCELETISGFVDEAQLQIFVISNPSAVTGIRKSHAEIEALVGSVPDTLFVVDEADTTDTESAARLTLTYPNLIVIRSFSKFYGLSGLRIGYIVTPEQYSKDFDRMINPAELTSVAIIAARAALDDIKFQRQTQGRVRRSLATIEDACKGTPYKIVPGSSCFASYIWADEGVEDPYLLLERNNVDIARGADFGLDRGGRMNLSDPDKVQIAADVIRQTAA